MRPADPGQLRSAWLTSGISDHLRSCGTSSDGYKMGTKFAPVLATRNAMFEPDSAELAGLEPATSWVRFRRRRLQPFAVLCRFVCVCGFRGTSLGERLRHLRWAS